jgi:uncharacterized protein (UPF0332 family)
MDEIKWCLKVKNGLELVEPNENLMAAYFKKAEDSLRAASVLKDNKDWEISSSYYTMYFALYAVLMKIGIKCEIHSCSIKFMKYFLNGYFDDGEVNLIEKSQKARIDAQYYSNRNISDELYSDIINNVASFLIKCKEVGSGLAEKEVKDIRRKLKC